MPAPKRRFYSSKDIQVMLGIGKTKANELMHMFDSQGKLLRIGQAMRVDIDTFEQWLMNQQGGTNDEQNCSSFGNQGLRRM